MRQYGFARIFGVVSFIQNDADKNTVSVCVIVNSADTHNLHTGKRVYYVSIFDGAYKSVIPYIRVGDMLQINDADLFIDYDKRKTFINVRHPWQLLLLASENRTTLQSRTDLGNSDPSSLGAFDNV